MDFYKLTPKDAAAIRQGNRIAIYYGAKYSGGSCHIVQDAPRDVPFPREAEHAMPVPVILNGYHPDGLGRLRMDAYAHASAFALVYLYKFAQGPFALLKAGDEIAFLFSHDNNSGYTRDAGLHVDSLSLVLKRAKGDVTLTLATSICPNNSARMVQNVDVSVGAY